MYNFMVNEHYCFFDLLGYTVDVYKRQPGVCTYPTMDKFEGWKSYVGNWWGFPFSNNYVHSLLDVEFFEEKINIQLLASAAAFESSI